MSRLGTQVPPSNDPLPPGIRPLPPGVEIPWQPLPPLEPPGPSLDEQIGREVGTTVGDWAASAFDSAMQSLWSAALAVLREAFLFADRFSIFTVSTDSGPVGALWPMMVWISGALALGLFFWQLALTAVRGGKGFLRLVIGPVQYGIALAITVGMVAALLVAADGLSYAILTTGLQAPTFTDAVTNDGGQFFFDWADSTSDVTKVLLGLLGLFLLLPAGICLFLEMVFREAAIYVLVATIPISAAGLLAGATARWYWTSLRWGIALITVKPGVSLVVVIGVSTVAEAQGLSGLLAGVIVLPISVLCPLVLFKLLVFVDPNTDSGAGLRHAVSSLGVPTFGDGMPLPGGDSAGGGGGGAQETATGQRFDDVAESAGGDNDRGFSADDVDDDPYGSSGGDDDSGGDHGGIDPPPPPPSPDDDGPGGGGGPGSGGSGPGPGGGGSGGAAVEAEEAAAAVAL
ncbi:hypothetical protein MOQ72_26930 [Saccharopolyspora sp. K220]|uniref:hypothetical protein n=1 Tax=Saccharopolyspora soli TaxID=2926618 RepID=UPI001F58BD5D|nr:hypothetical protein [Saccharopolyspora soli]MCI2421083.1 hypothetical protein [Saccharopolyspora soli]